MASKRVTNPNGSLDVQVAYFSPQEASRKCVAAYWSHVRETQAEKMSAIAVRHHEYVNDKLLKQLHTQGRSTILTAEMAENRRQWEKAQARLAEARLQAARERGGISPIQDELAERSRLALRSGR